MKPLLPLILLLALAGPASAQHWSRSWAAAPQPVQPNRPPPALDNYTVRQVVRISSGGARIRIRLSNEESAEALRIGAVRVALAGADGATVPGSDRAVTFGGERDTVIPAHAPLVSDPVALSVPPLARLAISIHLPAGAKAPTVHWHAAAIGWVAPGDQTAAVTLSQPSRFGQRLVVAGVDVETPRPAPVIVTLGDSITDGARATVGADTRWPDQLAGRLQAAGLRRVGVANLGIGANRVLKDYAGLNALARFDRDVLSVPGVRHLIVLEGVNDIGIAHRDKEPDPPSADDIIDGYRQMIARARDRGLTIRFGTVLPYKGAAYWSEGGEAVRQQLNAWIRTNKEADGFIDFDRAVRDPKDPASLRDPYDGGDNLHPNDAGFKAMAEAVDLKPFR